MKALIVIDMQYDFLTGSLGGEHCRRAIPGVLKLLNDNHKHWDMVFATQDTHGIDYSNTLEGKKLPIEHCRYGSFGWGIDSDILTSIRALSSACHASASVILCKPTFGSTDLPELIRDCYTHRVGTQGASMNSRGGDYEFHICGVCTSICVLANAVLLRANFPDAKIVIHASACGDVNEEMHLHALACLKAQQCDIVD